MMTPSSPRHCRCARLWLAQVVRPAGGHQVSHITRHNYSGRRRILLSLSKYKLHIHRVGNDYSILFSVALIKDKIMARQKAYNCPDLLKHILEKDSKHFEDKLIMIANGQFLQHQRRELRNQVNLVNLRKD